MCLLISFWFSKFYFFKVISDWQNSEGYQTKWLTQEFFFKNSELDNYFFQIKFVFFLYLLSSASWKENDLSWYIFVIRHAVGYRTPAFTLPFSLRLHITIAYILLHLRQWYVAVVTIYTGSRLPNISDVKTRKRRNMVGIDMIRNNRIRFYFYWPSCPYNI